MGNRIEFRNRKPKKINLVRWFSCGAIIGMVLATAAGLYANEWIESPLFMILGSGIICGWFSIKFRKWIMYTFGI